MEIKVHGLPLNQRSKDIVTFALQYLAANLDDANEVHDSDFKQEELDSLLSVLDIRAKS